MNVLILGCGRVGSTLARQLSQEGHSVTIIDLTGDAFRRLGPKPKAQRIVGTGMDQDVLRRAGIETADVFVAVTQGDNTNIMAAQIARRVFDVTKVIARIYDPIRAEAYRELGIETFCTTTLATSLMRSSIDGDPRMKPVEAILQDMDREYREQISVR
ncbi:MAG: TrkA family potassium uptake protein [Capsulimonadaceae bacterium]|nr:TrkA family potassium uptake protein [Capsulimonadaceae bacterium]